MLIALYHGFEEMSGFNSLLTFRCGEGLCFLKDFL